MKCRCTWSGTPAGPLRPCHCGALGRRRAPRCRLLQSWALSPPSGRSWSRPCRANPGKPAGPGSGSRNRGSRCSRQPGSSGPGNGKRHISGRPRVGEAAPAGVRGSRAGLLEAGADLVPASFIFALPCFLLSARGRSPPALGLFPHLRSEVPAFGEESRACAPTASEGITTHDRVLAALSLTCWRLWAGHRPSSAPTSAFSRGEPRLGENQSRESRGLEEAGGVL